MSDEELESIPWSTLIEGNQPQRSKLIYIAAAAIIVFALAVLVTRSVGSTTPAPITAAVATPVATTAPMPEPAAPVLFSEADLMAVIEGETARAAAAFAEWFVYDYFTVDGDPATLLSVQRALPPGVPEELLPHNTIGVVTYVEWASAARVTEITPGRFQVLVLFRMVAADDGSTFERQPVRAVDVSMEMGDTGGLRLTDLPAPAHIPQRPQVAEWVRPEGAPETLEIAGMTAAFSWDGLDTDLRIQSSSLDDGGWRVLAINHMPEGVRWPFVVSFSDDLLPD